MAGVKAIPQIADFALVRSIRKWDLVAVTINAVIGAGIFGLPSKIYALVGDYSLPAFLLCGFFAALIVLCFAEVASRFTATGGPYLYAREAFGPMAGFLVGWLMWIARVSAFAANTSIMLSYLGLFWPAVTSGPVRAVAVCALTLALTMLNLLGVREVATTTNILTVGKLAPLALLIVVGLFYVDTKNFSFGAAPAPLAFSSAMMLLVYAYTGFEMAVIPAAEIRDPHRDLPKAILIAIVLIAVFYILIQVVCIGTLPQLSVSERPLADAARHFLGQPGAAIITAGAVLSVFANLNIVLFSASRLPFAMAGRGELPRFLAAVNERFRTPHIAILLTATVMAALTLSGTFLYAVTISTIARLAIYAVTCAALPILRKRDRLSRPAFRVPAGVAVSVAVLLLTAWLLWNSTNRERRDTAIASTIGLIVYSICRRPGRVPSRNQ
jgi:amino acid transporter